jgi:hypothetical protein
MGSRTSVRGFAREILERKASAHRRRRPRHSRRPSGLGRARRMGDPHLSVGAARAANQHALQAARIDSRLPARRRFDRSRRHRRSQKPGSTAQMRPDHCCIVPGVERVDASHSWSDHPRKAGKSPSAGPDRFYELMRRTRGGVDAQSFEFDTNAMRLLSGDQPGVFIEPWPP